MIDIVTFVGLATYASSVVVGLLARRGRIHARAVHQALFAGNLTLIGLALYLAYHPARVGVFIALAVMPWTQPRGNVHAFVGVVGLGAYLWAVYAQVSP
ncbi:MAG: hypothetical protein V3V08_04610 [Nannocystaceae bacterium]